SNFDPYYPRNRMADSSREAPFAGATAPTQTERCRGVPRTLLLVSRILSALAFLSTRLGEVEGHQTLTSSWLAPLQFERLKSLSGLGWLDSGCFNGPEGIIRTKRED